MQLQLGNILEATPIGCRIVFALSAGCYLLFTFNHHEFITLDLVCRPVDVIFGWQVQRLVLASFVHTSLLGLLLAFLVCWRRFSWLERQTGTVGFLIWFAWSSAVLHGAHCLAMLCLSPVLGWGMLGSEVHGLFPLLMANLVLSIKDSDSSTVWLWPLPFHVSIRLFPVVIIFASWLLHWEVHFDIITAYCLASTCPAWFVEPAAEVVDRAEQSTAGKWLVAQLQVSDAFIFRPSTADGLSSSKVPQQSTVSYHADWAPVVSSAAEQSTAPYHAAPPMLASADLYHADRASAASSAADEGSFLPLPATAPQERGRLVHPPSGNLPGFEPMPSAAAPAQALAEESAAALPVVSRHLGGTDSSPSHSTPDMGQGDRESVAFSADPLGMPAPSQMSAKDQMHAKLAARAAKIEEQGP